MSKVYFKEHGSLHLWGGLGSGQADERLNAIPWGSLQKNGNF